MINIKKYNRRILRTIKNRNISTKVLLYFSTLSTGDDYDEYEDLKTSTLLNPITVIGYQRELTPESSFFKQYGKSQSGIVEFLCEEKYRNTFEKASKIVINNIEYSVFLDGLGNRSSIVKRPFRMIRVTLSRKD